MNQLKAYHRPASVEEALGLLSRPNVHTAVIGGGTQAVPRLAETVDEVIDLQHVGLADISLTGSGLTLGAMVRLQTLVDDERLPELLREAARREGPNTLRHAATVGGLIVGASPESELLAALLVCQAIVRVQNSQGTHNIPLADLLADVPAALGGGLVTSVSLTPNGRTAATRVARTPADSPIVAAVARLADDNQLHLALCGVAPTPVLVDPDTIEAALTPPDDFRGSAEYRRQMALTLSRRVIAALTAAG